MMFFPNLVIKSGRNKGDRTLRHRLIMPPFSVFDARQGYWQDRKRAWISLGIKSELGRGENLLMESEEVTTDNLNYYRNKSKKEKDKEALLYKNQSRLNEIMREGKGKNKRTKKGSLLIGTAMHGYDNGPEGGDVSKSGTSIFDPVLCEIIYSWFVPKGGSILDPFAGGSVRGIIANYLGFYYIGIDLSEPQVKANYEQATKIVPTHRPTWIVGDSSNLNNLIEADKEFDFVFSCPPYHDLEQYSDNPDDLSNMNYRDFLKAYFNIIEIAVSRLKEDRFACFVVGEIRDKKTGLYKGFVPDTIRAFRRAGMAFYNEGILITQVGSLPIRTKIYFKSRKLGKTHQNVLIFYKGDPNNIKENFGEELDGIEEQ